MLPNQLERSWQCKASTNHLLIHMHMYVRIGKHYHHNVGYIHDAMMRVARTCLPFYDSTYVKASSQIWMTARRLDGVFVHY